MTMVGPRVYSVMAKDRYLPKVFAAKEGKPPAVSVVAQGVIALCLLYTHTISQIVESVGGIMILFSIMTVVALFRKRFRAATAGIKKRALVAGLIYIASASVIFVIGVYGKPYILIAYLIIAGVGFGAYPSLCGGWGLTLLFAGQGFGA